jgi:hypothetical protein
MFMLLRNLLLKTMGREKVSRFLKMACPWSLYLEEKYTSRWGRQRRR